MAVNSGVAAFNMPVNADETCCSANGNIDIGNANHTTAKTATLARSSRWIGAREPGKHDSTENPISMRVKVMPIGAAAFSPSAMNRNDDPQISAGPTISNVLELGIAAPRARWGTATTSTTWASLPGGDTNQQ